VEESSKNFTETQ
jgi:hypothetical protein